MNHASIIEHEAERPYRNRSNIMHKLDTLHFHHLNTGDHVLTLNGYCLDAIDEIPSGSMRPMFERPSQAYMVRGFDAAEILAREVLAEKLIAELLAEEAGNEVEVPDELGKE